ncbi:MAG: RIP metalloprotease RseP [Methylophilaceae bacterium]|nr:RIP metalloprotease RseP [Methylophilaceae bacterium]
MITLASFIFTLAVLIAIHEYGHFQAARWCGVKVLKFSLGFGKAIYSKHIGRDRTEFAISVIPLGGFVKMLDERELAPEELAQYDAESLNRAFNRQSVWKRMAIVIAGPAANLLLAILLYWVLMMQGVTGIKPVLGEVDPESAAGHALFKQGDLIHQVADEKVSTWQDVQWSMLKQAINKQKISIQTINSKADIGQIGAVVAIDEKAFSDALITTSYSSSQAILKSINKTWETSVFSLKMMGNMLTGQASIKSISGPVTIANYAGQSAHLGIKAFIGFLAMISISLGVLNLLPIPVLDGGHLLYYTVELIKGSPVSEKTMEIGQRIGLTIIFMLMMCAVYNDINRLIAG